jgi:hypothetical protein
MFRLTIEADSFEELRKKAFAAFEETKPVEVEQLGRAQEIVKQTEKMVNFISSMDEKDIVPNVNVEKMNEHLRDIEQRPNPRYDAAVPKGPIIPRESITPLPNVDGRRDSAGMLWDARIHSSSKEFVKDGTWRYRRNLDSEYRKQIEAEILGTTPPTVAVGRPTPEVTPAVAPLQPERLNTPPPISTPMSPVFGNKYAHTLETFQQNLVSVVANLINDQKITREYVKSLNDYFKVNELYEIFSNPLQVKELYDNFVDIGLIERVQ